MNHGVSLFDERKAAQAAAYLLLRAGGTLDVIKLVKLLYLAERLHYQRYGEPLTGDRLVSMPNGPALSLTLDHVNGGLRSRPGGWQSWIAACEGNMVALRETERAHVNVTEDDFDMLSDSDVEALGEIWDKFGHWDKWRIVDYTHEGGCPEWHDPCGSSVPIRRVDLFRALGFDEDQTRDLIQRLREHESIAQAMSA